MKQLDELILFIETDKLNNSEIEEIIAFLRNELPDFMIPKVIQPIQSLPLNSNQKIDYNQLNQFYFSNKSI